MLQPRPVAEDHGFASATYPFWFTDEFRFAERTARFRGRDSLALADHKNGG